MATTPNMGLEIPDIGDTDYPNDVSTSFTKMDEHDHTNGKGKQIPTGGIQDGAITASKVEDGAITSPKLDASVVDDSTLALTTNLHVKDSGITTDKIDDGAVTRTKLDPSIPFVPAGVIFPFGGISAPPGFIFCFGQEISRSTYSVLFSVLGTRFGSGDGSTTFNVPDGRGQFLRGALPDLEKQFLPSDVDVGNDEITIVDHGFYTGLPIRLRVSDDFTETLPSPLSAGLAYYVIKTSVDKFKLALSLDDALSGTSVNITNSGTVVGGGYFYTIGARILLTQDSYSSSTTGASNSIDEPGAILARHRTGNSLGFMGGGLLLTDNLSSVPASATNHEVSSGSGVITGGPHGNANHTHTITGFDPETTPIHMLVNYIISVG